MKKVAYRDTIQKCNAYNNPYDERWATNSRMRQHRAELYRLREDGIEGPQARFEREMMAKFQYLRLASKGEGRGVAFAKMAAFAVLFPGYLLFIVIPKWVFMQAMPFIKKQAAFNKNVLKHLKILTATLSQTLGKIGKLGKNIGERAKSIAARMMTRISVPIEKAGQILQKKIMLFARKLQTVLAGPKKTILNLHKKIVNNFSLPEIKLPKWRMPKLEIAMPKFGIAMPKISFPKIPQRVKKFPALLAAQFERGKKSFSRAAEVVFRRAEGMIALFRKPIRAVITYLDKRIEKMSKRTAALLERSAKVVERAAQSSVKILQAAVIIPFVQWVQQPMINLFIPLMQRFFRDRKRRRPSFKGLGQVVNRIVRKVQKFTNRISEEAKRVISWLQDLAQWVALQLIRAFELAKKFVALTLLASRKCLYGLKMALVVIKIMGKILLMIVRQMVIDFGRLLETK